MRKLNFSGILIIAIFFLLVAIFGTKLTQFKSMANAEQNSVLPPETVSTFTVQKQSWTKSLYSIGSIEPVQGVLLQSEVDGVVRTINFENGTKVKKGDLLIQLDVSVENAELKAAQALAHLSELELERARRLEKSGNIPESDLDRALAEAASFSKKSGISSKDVLDVISKGAAQSWQMENRWDSMINDQYNFGFAVDLMVKDLEIVSKFSKKIGANISVTEMIKSYYKELQDMGAGKLDTSSLLKRLDEKDNN